MIKDILDNDKVAIYHMLNMTTCTFAYTLRLSPDLTDFLEAVASGVACKQETISLPGHPVSMFLYSVIRNCFNENVHILPFQL